MGKRKKAAKKPVTAKKKVTLDSTFQCLFCNHEKAVNVRLDKKAGIGYLTCKVCGQSFQHQINYLSAAIDVYSEWIDACDAVAKEAPDVTGKSARTSYRDIDHTSRVQASQGAGEMDDFVEDDEDAEADFLDE